MWKIVKTPEKTKNNLLPQMRVEKFCLRLKKKSSFEIEKKGENDEYYVFNSNDKLNQSEWKSFAQ